MAEENGLNRGRLKWGTINLRHLVPTHHLVVKIQEYEDHGEIYLLELLVYLSILKQLTSLCVSALIVYVNMYRYIYIWTKLFFSLVLEALDIYKYYNK